MPNTELTKQVSHAINQAMGVATMVGHYPEQLEILAEMVAKTFHGNECHEALKLLVYEMFERALDSGASLGPDSAIASLAGARDKKGRLVTVGPPEDIIDGPAPLPASLHAIVYNGGVHAGDWYVIYGFDTDAIAKAWAMAAVSPQELAWYYVEAKDVYTLEPST